MDEHRIDTQHDWKTSRLGTTQVNCHHEIKWSNGEVEKIDCGGQFDDTCIFCRGAQYDRPLTEVYKVHKNQDGYRVNNVFVFWSLNRDADGKWCYE